MSPRWSLIVLAAQNGVTRRAGVLYSQTRGMHAGLPRPVDIRFAMTLCRLDNRFHGTNGRGFQIRGSHVDIEIGEAGMRIDSRWLAVRVVFAVALLSTAQVGAQDLGARLVAVEATSGAQDLSTRPVAVEATSGAVTSVSPYTAFNASAGQQSHGIVEHVSPRDPKDPVRVVIELKDQPLIPYLRQLRAEQANAVKNGARISTRERRNELAQAFDSQRHVLEQAQTQLIGDMRREGWIKQEHRRFAGLLNAVAITTQYGHLSAINDDPRVASVHMDAKVQALLDTSVGVVGAPAVWAMRDGNGNAVTGQGVTIAIIDTGIDYRHPDLGGCFGPGCKVIGGFDFVNGDEDPLDDNGHGTHVAGIAAANGGVRGVAPDAHLVAYKALDLNGNGFNSVVIAAIERAVDPDGNPLTDDAANVISMSLGSDEASTGPLALAANRAMDAGIVVVAAAGNYGDYRSVQSPGVAERIVTVGAANNNGQIAGFSSRGPVEDKDFVKPELVAPGVDIRSTWLGGDYHVLSGTSMATPHVAGAAALMRQLHPMLDSQELKALLVNNARDLGLDVFTQGAGMLDVAASASAAVVIMPAIPSFGGVDIEQPQWQAKLPVTLKNISPQDWTATVQPAPAPLGAEVAFGQPEGFAVAAGQTTMFDLTVAVDNQLLPFPAAPTLHHESALSLLNAGGSVRLPWLLFKAATLNLVVHGRPDTVIVSSGDNCGGFPCWRPFQETNCLVWDAQRSATRSIRVSPGKYHAFALYADPSDSCEGFTKSVVFKDADTSSSAILRIDDADAKNRIHVGNVVDTAGLLIAPPRLKVVGSTFNIFHPASELAFLIGQSAVPRDGDTIFHISDVPDGYRLNVDAVAIDTDSQFSHRRYFVLGDLLTGAVQGGVALDLDAASEGGVTFEYSDVKELADGVNFWPGAGLLSMPGNFGIVAMSMGGPKEGPYFSPFKVTAFAARPRGRAGERAPQLLITRSVGPNGNGGLRQLLDTNPVAILNDDEYVKFDGTAVKSTGTIDLTHVNFKDDGHKVRISNGPVFLSTQFLYSSFVKMFTPIPATGSQNGFVAYPFLDMRQNLISDEFNYELICDGVSVVNESSNVLYTTFIDRECTNLRAVFDFETRLFTHIARSTAEINLIANVATDSPVVRGLTFTSDSRVTRVLSGDVLQLRLKASPEFADTHSPNPPLPAMVDYRLDDTASWTPLDLIRDGDGYVGSLPVINGAHIGSLRIQLRDRSGSSMTQTLNSLFLIGKNANSLAGSAVPTFGELPELTVPATGLLTPFDLPAVTASDALDGTIAATTANIGPYPAGRNAIRWTAVNSADVMASATQILNVVDLTPPQVTPPPSITRPATGVYTAIDLGQAAAVDKEEGALVALPHPSGPFTVGSHQVNWTATDSSGNRGSATQTVTITGDASPPPVLTIGDASVEEGDTGTRDLIFPVTLSHPSDRPVSFGVSTSDLSATSGLDYVAMHLPGMVIPTGASRVEIRVPIIPDTSVEPSETFAVSLSDVVGALADNTRAIGTIIDDDNALETIQTIAGTGTAAFTGDNGPAVQAAISFPAAIALSRDGAIVFADARNHRIRRIAVDGTIHTIAGNGSAGFSGDGGPALDAALNFPTGLAIDGQGRVFIADTQNHRVRMIAPDGTISTIAGGSVGAFAGDGGPAVDALLRSPGGIAVDLSGNLYVADTGNVRVRRIDSHGVITTIAGNGSFDSSGDGGPALAAGLVPGAVAVDAADNVYVTEGDSRRVRRIDAQGVIWPFLGGGQVGGSNGDGGPALSASLRFPVGVAVDAEGNVYVIDAADNRVRKVTAEGIVSTVAGGGPGTGFTGDGGPATDASLLNPRAAAIDAAGNLFIADSNNQRVRRVGTRRFALDARDRFVWFVPPPDDALHQGFLRIRNPLAQPLTAQFWGVDEEGVRSPGSVVATLPASGALQLNSLDLAFGNADKGLSGRLGEGVGSWTLVTRAAQPVEPLSYIRTPDGFLTSMHDRVAGDGIDWRVPMFNPASNPNQVSHLRLVNTEPDPVAVLIDGIDDSGQPGAETVAATLPSLSALDLSASDLELGNVEKGLAGHLGQGSGKWQLHLSATGRIVAQNQLLDPNGNITNLSTIADAIGQAPGLHTLWFFPAASDVQHQGFVRLINRETRSGQVRVWGIDDAGATSPGAITLTLAPNESRQFNSRDAAFGNANKGLTGSLGTGTGDWRLVVASDLELQAMAFIRTPDGFLTSMHDVGAVSGTSLQIPIFNPAQNPNQVSWLRLINPNGIAVTAVIDGVDDAGVRAAGHVSLNLPAYAAIEISATDLETGNPALGLSGSLGDGEGKWVLEVTSSAPIKAISLLRDPRGFITNLSRDARTSSRLDP